jgi:hypothetical protein
MIAIGDHRADRGVVGEELLDRGSEVAGLSSTEVVGHDGEVGGGLAPGASHPKGESLPDGVLLLPEGLKGQAS